MRDILTHHYFGVDLDLTWEVIKEDLPNLKNQVITIKEEYKEFTQIRGIGLSSAEEIVEMGITSVEELAALEVEKLETDIPIATVKRWVRNAKKHLGEELEEEELEEELEELV